MPQLCPGARGSMTEPVYTHSSEQSGHSLWGWGCAEMQRRTQAGFCTGAGATLLTSLLLSCSTSRKQSVECLAA